MVTCCTCCSAPRRSAAHHIKNENGGEKNDEKKYCRSSSRVSLFCCTTLHRTIVSRNKKGTTTKKDSCIPVVHSSGTPRGFPIIYGGMSMTDRPSRSSTNAPLLHIQYCCNRMANMMKTKSPNRRNTQAVDVFGHILQHAAPHHTAPSSRHQNETINIHTRLSQPTAGVYTYSGVCFITPEHVSYPQPHIYTFTEFHSCKILFPSLRTNILDEVT